jgi:hypothetical protein
VTVRFCRRLSVAAAPDATVRFRVPRGFSLDVAYADRNLLFLWKGKPGRAADPDLVVTVTRYATPVEDVADGLRRQREAYQGRSDRILRVCEAVRLGKVEAGKVEVVDDLEGRADVTYFRAIGGSVWIAGYRRAPGLDVKAVDAAARAVAASLEVRSARASADAEWIEARASGFAFRPPKGWERQDLFGQHVFFAPGEGDRPRIAVAADGAQGAAWGSARKRASMRQAGLRTMYRPFQAITLKPLALAGVKGLRLDWRGFLPAKEAWVRGAHLFLPKGKGGAEFSLIVPEEGASFGDWEVDVLATAAAVRWLPKKDK